MQSLNHWTTRELAPFFTPSHGLHFHFHSLQLVPFRTSPQFIRHIYMYLYHHNVDHTQLRDMFRQIFPCPGRFGDKKETSQGSKAGSW